MDDFRKEVVGQYQVLLRFAQKFTVRDQAEDLVQNTIIRAFERQHQFTPGTRLDSWLYRILQNLFLDHRRAQKVRNSIEFGEIEEELLELSLAANQEAITYYGQVTERLQRLPCEQREVLSAVAIEGLSYQEAAERIGIPIGTVMSRTARARRNLTALCSKRNPHETCAPPTPRSRTTRSFSLRHFQGRQPVLLLRKPTLYLPAVFGAEVKVFRLL